MVLSGWHRILLDVRYWESSPSLELHTETHCGLWSPGPPAQGLDLPGDMPSSDDRTDIPSFDSDQN